VSHPPVRVDTTCSGAAVTANVEAGFAAFVERATGHAPYPYQARIAHDGLPELLQVPTGCGKTLAAVLPWLFRRREHPDAQVRATTPHWLVFVLPMRVLVEQTADAVRQWITNVGLESEVGVHVVMGGEGRADGAWRSTPERDAIFIGTLDMIVSRALNRGYGESRFAWPIDFGLFNSGCQWVFDEVQLMGAALPTSRQLHGLRRKLGTAAPCMSTWMSATVDVEVLATIDCPEVATSLSLGSDDHHGALLRRLDATRRVEELVVSDDPKHFGREIADALLDHHAPGTLTLTVLNTVERATRIAQALEGRTSAEIVLLHSRFRPAERKNHADAALAAIPPGGPGRIVVSTQVVEAGVDISATTLLTEVAPWPSIVQRAGRCNRDGNAANATLLWVAPPAAAPYPEPDVRVSLEALRALEGRDMTGSDLGDMEVATTRQQHEVLRRRDLVELFDTTSDLSGNDVDVSRFVRDDDDLNIQIAWRSLDDGGPSPDDVPVAAELCPVPVGQARKFAKDHDLWRFDHLDRSRWVRCRPADVRPGLVLIAADVVGGYSPELGWAPDVTGPVAPIATDEEFTLVASVEGTADDPVSYAPRAWVALRDHLADVERETRAIASSLRLDGLEPEYLEAAAIAARLHDVGKAHEVFQDTLARSCHDGEEPTGNGPWAKSGGTKAARHARRYFRHELVSALMLLGDAAPALEGAAEPDLVRYLVAAHHGRVRLGIRSLDDEERDAEAPDARVALGVFDGDEVPAVEVPGEVLPACVLDLATMELGDRSDGAPSWSARMLVLRDREDLGPFRLGFLEALVRLADWRASASPGGART
jgi:CRISPR-associated endonuclease/helicase Cas3